MLKRRRFKHQLTLRERLLLSAGELRKTAEQLIPGKERHSLLRRAQENEAAARIDNWLSSPGLRRPD
jgi:hypothetical protein